MDHVQVSNGHNQYLEATSSTVVTIQTENNTDTQNNANIPILKLRLKQPKTDKKVQWSESAVDNEHMNKKKSKCCCIYKKPQEFNESSSDDDSECNNCRGHVELKKKNFKD